MSYHPRKSVRRSIRRRGYDYSQEGAYFITICTHGREDLFGGIVDGKMRLNGNGVIVRDEWLRSGRIRREIQMGEFAVMPNHIHGVVFFKHDNQTAVGATGGRPILQDETSSPEWTESAHNRRLSLPAHGPDKSSLASFIAGFKSANTKSIGESLGLSGIPVWQRNYYEHIIRNEKTLRAISDYIRMNPSNWASDSENPFADMAERNQPQDLSQV
jgi:putative transposase